MIRHGPENYFCLICSKRICSFKCFDCCEKHLRCIGLYDYNGYYVVPAQHFEQEKIYYFCTLCEIKIYPGDKHNCREDKSKDFLDFMIEINRELK